MPEQSDTPNEDQFRVDLNNKLWDLYDDSKGFPEVFIPAAVDLFCFLIDKIVARTVDMTLEADSN